MRVSRPLPRALAAFAAVLALSACSAPPDETVAAARASEAAALEAGAQVYAPDALPAVAAAREALEAELAVQEGKMALTRSFRRAGELAQAYQAAADQAAAAASAAYEQAKNETVEFMNRGWADLAAAPSLLASVPRGRLSAQELAALRAEVALAEERLRAADPLIPHGRYLEAREYAREAVDALARVKDAVARAQEGAGGA